MRRDADEGLVKDEVVDELLMVSREDGQLVDGRKYTNIVGKLCPKVQRQAPVTGGGCLCDLCWCVPSSLWMPVIVGLFPSFDLLARRGALRACNSNMSQPAH
jgi:hypothetical protein